MLLEIGKACDDHSRAKKDNKILEQFGYIITFFDRCDATYTTLNQIVFMDNIEVTEKMLRTIYHNKKIFDELSPKLFKEIFVDPVLRDRYLTEFGKQKLYTIFKGLKEIEKGDLSLSDVVQQVSQINQHACLYSALRQAAKTILQQEDYNLKNPSARERLYGQLTQQMQEKRLTLGPLSKPIFDKVLRDLVQEDFYVNEVLPRMVRNPDKNLREKFLKESRLDRYYIEELESEYFDRYQLSGELLQQIQSAR